MALAKLNTNTGPAQAYTCAWDGAAADYNILANGPGYDSVNQVGTCCRRLVVAGTGDLVVTDFGGNAVTIPSDIIAVKHEFEIQATALVETGSGAALSVWLEW